MIHARKDYQHIQDPSGQIPADEPVFLLRGKDVNTPAVIRRWAQLARENGADQLIVEAAERHASVIEDWQAANGSKIPDMPTDAA